MATDPKPGFFDPNKLYVTHTKCDGIVEVASIEGDVAVYVYCPTCQDIVEQGELSCDTCYLVPMPEPVPEPAVTTVNSAANSPTIVGGSEP